MAATCPHCSAANADGALYCVTCGYPLATTPSPQPAAAPPPPPYLAAFGAPAAPSQPMYSSPAAPSQPMYSTGAPYAVQVQTAQQPALPAQIGANQGGASFRRAFAGRGTPIMHQSWLLDGAANSAPAVRNGVTDLMRARGILNTSITPERLVERGVLMEVRDYIEIHRGVSTVFTYVAPAGKDLYISRATAVQPAISRLRALVMIVLLFILLVGFASASSTASDASYGFLSVPSVPQLLAISLTPLILVFFILFGIFSAVNWVVDKDFWVYLRPRTLNDFQLDDIALLEHATDGVVADAVKQEGLDASKITPPPLGYQPKRRIRAV